RQGRGARRDPAGQRQAVGPRPETGRDAGDGRAGETGEAAARRHRAAAAIVGAGPGAGGLGQADADATARAATAAASLRPCWTRAGTQTGKGSQPWAVRATTR